jgi:DNA repair exonuclease SbcCD ATPase subunit
MKIQKLQLHNFRSHEATEFVFGSVNLIRGMNASGKSSLGDAIEYALTGRYAGTDEAGRGSEAAIRLGAKECAVTARITNGQENSASVEITRTRNGAGGNATMKFGGRNYVGRQCDQFLEKWGFGKDVLSAALRAGRFLELSPAGQKELLADVLRPDAQTIPDEILEAMELSIGTPDKPEVTLEDARQIEAIATRVRAECTSALREFGEPDAVPDRPKDTPSLEQIRGKLDGLRSDQMRLRVEKERIENKWAEASRRWRELPQLIEQHKAHLLDSETEKRYMEAIDHEPKRKRTEEEIAGVAALVSEYSRQLAAISSQAGKCPTCGRETDTDEMRARIEKLSKAAQSRLPTLESIRDKYGDLSASECRRLLAESREATVALAKCEKEHREGSEPKPPETKKLEKQTDELEARIQKGQQVLSEASADDQRRRTYQEAVAKRSEVERRREAADKLAKWAGPNGVQAQMSAGKIGPFTDQMNAILERFGYACSVSLGPYEMLVRRGPGSLPGLPIESLSESERWRFSLAFQVALAKVSGINLVVCDRADVLDAENRGVMGRTALDCGLDQVIILATAEAKPLDVPNLTVFDLELRDGKTKLKGANQ